MKKKNPFDLAGRADGPAAPEPGRVWTPEEQEEKLAGYMEIEPRHWDQVRHGTHMRYYTKAGEYRPGGFVLKNPFDTAPRGAAAAATKRFFKLQNGFNERAPGYQQWLAAYEDVARVYIKPDAGTLQVASSLGAAVDGFNANIRRLAGRLQEVDARLQRLEARVGALEAP